MTIDLLHLMTLDTPSTYRQMLDYLFNVVDDCLWDEEELDPPWPTISLFLRDVPVDDISIQLGVGILSCTWPIKSKSSAYQEFATVFRKKIEKTEDPDRVEGLMQGFES